MPQLERYVVEQFGVTRDQLRISATVAVERGLVQLTGAKRVPVRENTNDRPAAPSHDGMWKYSFDGRLAIDPQGSLWSCIFDRSASLGNAAPAGLAEAMEALKQPFGADLRALRENASRHKSRLACWQCQMRASMMALYAAHLASSQETVAGSSRT